MAYSCPGCGAPLEARFHHTKLIACGYCGSTVFLRDQAVELAGKQSVLPETPSIFALHQPVTYRTRQFIPVGKARFEYDRGFWEEWWAMDQEGGYWISVDEGDIALEQPISLPAAVHPPKVGEKIDLADQPWVVTEIGDAQCVGIAGELPEVIQAGDRFRYWHLSGPRGALLTLEQDEDGWHGFQGQWVDPFEVRAG